MKFADNKFELSRNDADLVGLRPYQAVGFDELHDLLANTWVAYETAAVCMWRCFDAATAAGLTLDEIMGADETNSFDIWALGKLAVYIELVMSDDIQSMVE